ncbi:hypothetical protein [Azospirillum doebereinerae]
MALPPPAKLQELAEIFQRNAPTSFEPFSETKAKIVKYSKMLVIAGAQSGLQTAVTMGVGAPTVAIGVGIGSIALFPLGAALGPWLGALAIGAKANGIFALHDLRSSAARKGDNNYTCSCGKCVENLTYVINRKENNVAIMATGIFTAGLTIIADRLNSVRKSFQKNRPKEKVCSSLVAGSRGGCVCAIASVMMICGEWKQEDKPDQALVAEAVAVIWSSDGHARLKSKW